MLRKPIHASIGYCPIHKGYRCSEPTSKRVHISQRVVFDKETFPCKMKIFITNSSSLVLLEFPPLDEWIGDRSKLLAHWTK